ncbi:MAG: PilZ domain-containing protein [Candidatus Sulfotelmatobacter sp.]
MTSDMAFECLLISRDPAVVCVMNKLLDELSISTKVCLSPSRAFDQLAGRNTDLVIVDWDEDSAELLTGIRKSNGWRKPTVVAVSPSNCTVRGADIVLPKPVTDSSVTKSLKAAYSRMLYDHRRHTRYALMSKVTVTDERGRSTEAIILDIGDGGVGISVKEEFAVGDVLCFRLLLPGADRTIYIQARVQWTRAYGALGCEFLRIPPVDLNILSDWLTGKNQIKKPLGAMKVNRNQDTGWL